MHYFSILIVAFSIIHRLEEGIQGRRDLTWWCFSCIYFVMHYGNEAWDIFGQKWPLHRLLSNLAKDFLTRKMTPLMATRAVYQMHQEPPPSLVIESMYYLPWNDNVASKRGSHGGRKSRTFPCDIDKPKLCQIPYNIKTLFDN